MTPELVWLVALAVAVVVSATLINRFAKPQRSRLRRVVVLYMLYAGSVGAMFALRTLGTDWVGAFVVAGDLFRVFVIVNLGVSLVFLLIFPTVGIKLPMIAGDLLAGVAYLVGIFGVLGRHGLNPTSVIATGAVMSAVLVISLQTTLGNILGGVALQLDGSLHEGDFILLADGKQGTVRSVRWRHTLLETETRATLVVPNSLLLANSFTILEWADDRLAPAAITVEFFVDVSTSPNRVIEVVSKALADSPIAGVVTDPPPTCMCTMIDRDGVATFLVRYHAADLRFVKETTSRILVRIHATLGRANVAFSARAQVKADPRGTERYLEALRKMSLFDALTDEEMAELAESMTYAPYAAGETIAHQDATASSMFILASGSVEVRTTFDPDGAGPAPPQEALVATLTALDFFGEMGLITGEPRKADVIAKTDVECYRIKKPDFEKILLGRPEIAKALSDTLAQRALALRAVHADMGASESRTHLTERERIHSNIKKFFGLTG